MHIRWALLITILGVSVCHCNDLNIDGFVHPEWEFIRRLFRNNIENDDELGASVAVYYRGRPVVNLWGGWFNQSKTNPYTNNTLQVAFSTTKGLVATAVALCVERGLLDYSAPVVKYWPEYGSNGKENTTVADILSHRAGLPRDIQPTELMLNWTASVDQLATRMPEWIPGTAHGYHGLTFGWLAGELVRRVDEKQRPFGQFVYEEITKPLNIEFYIGLPEEEEYRVSPVYFDSSVRQILGPSRINEFSLLNNKQYLKTQIPGANGITNARSVARLYASLIGDIEKPRHHRLIDEQTITKATKSNTPPGEVDLIRGFVNEFSMGFQTFDDIHKLFQAEAFGHEGAGGSIGFAIPERQLSFAYMVNRYGIKRNPQEVNHRIHMMIQQIARYIQ